MIFRGKVRLGKPGDRVPRRAGWRPGALLCDSRTTDGEHLGSNTEADCRPDRFGGGGLLPRRPARAAPARRPRDRGGQPPQQPRRPAADLPLQRAHHAPPGPGSAIRSSTPGTGPAGARSNSRLPQAGRSGRDAPQRGDVQGGDRRAPGRGRAPDLSGGKKPLTRPGWPSFARAPRASRCRRRRAPIGGSACRSSPWESPTRARSWRGRR